MNMSAGIGGRGAQALQRSAGVARVAVAAGAGGRVGLRSLYQAGSAKAITLLGGSSPEVVFLNTSGGLTGGDRLEHALTLGPGVRLAATTQTAERAYRAGDGVARVRVRHSIGAGGHLDWLPQETILFDGAALERHTVLELAGDATCLMLEAVVLGRAAMGERVNRLHLRDRREILRAGRPVHVEPLSLDDPALRAGAAVLDGARAMASLVLVAPGAADALGPVRAALTRDGVRAGASAVDDRLVVRMLAGDGWPLRRQILALLAVLRRGPPPRVWQG